MVPLPQRCVSPAPGVPRHTAGGLGSPLFRRGGTYILSAAAQHHVTAGPAPLDVAHGGGDQGILEEEERAVVVQDEDVVLGGQELPVAVREKGGHGLADEMPPAAEHLEVQALGVCGTERPEGREIGSV